MDIFLELVSILSATLRISTPLIFASMAGLFAERSGTIDFSLEGKMLAAAFVAASSAYVFGSEWYGLLAAILCCIALSMLHGFASVTYKGDQVVSCVAINIMMIGLTAALAAAWFKKAGVTPTLNDQQRFHEISFPFVEQISNIPILGIIYSELISGHHIFIYLAYISVPIVYWIVFKTSFGLQLRAVGENPSAVDTAGISVSLLRYKALAINGILIAFAGTYLSTAVLSHFSREMSAGRGYLALAALIFGKWRPKGALIACLIFAFTDALQMRLQGVAILGIGVIPVQFIQAIPYVLTVVLLAGFVGKAVAPSAIGQPYIKER
jgi:simple sugar transport system permease protein|tara:strand:+ start:3714 stop:4685 length:972 start_codon:yes stop_codon:yes gene_type:complete